MSDTENVTRHTIQLQADTGELIERLRNEMYGQDIANIVIQRAVQNSAYTIKAAQLRGEIKRGDIDITTQMNTPSITVKDNGMGMTPDMVRDAFFTQSGGGLSLAELARVFRVKSMVLASVHDGIKTEVRATSEQIRRGRFEMVERATEERNGTLVNVEFPERVFSGSDGPGLGVYIPLVPAGVKVLNGFFDVEDVDVRLNGQSAGQRPPQQRIDTLTFEWGQVDVHFGHKGAPWLRHKVLSNGVWQFDEFFRDAKEGHLPALFDVALDVRPGVLATDSRYPFNNQRDGWRETVEKDIEKIRAHVSELIQGETQRETDKQLSQLKLLQRVNPLHPDLASASAPADARGVDPRDLMLVQEYVMEEYRRMSQQLETSPPIQRGRMPDNGYEM